MANLNQLTCVHQFKPFVAGLVTDTLYRCQQIIEQRCQLCGFETMNHMKNRKEWSGKEMLTEKIQ